MPLKLISDGGGSVILAAQTAATNYTLTVPAVTANVVTTGDSGSVKQTMLAAGVVGNGPAFSAYMSVNQNPVTASTFVKVRCDTKEFDTASCYDNVTNYRFTPNVAGYYQFNACTLWNNGSAGYTIAAIFKNGSSYKTKYSTNSAGTSTEVTALIYANGTTDYFEFYGYYYAGTNFYAAGQTITYFQAFLARAA